jgi:histidine ammonia-lyase
VRGLSAMVDEDRSLGAEIEAVGAGVLKGELAATLRPSSRP